MSERRYIFLGPSFLVSMLDFGAVSIQWNGPLRDSNDLQILLGGDWERFLLGRMVEGYILTSFA